MLKVVSSEVALELINEKLVGDFYAFESVPISEALGRVLCDDIVSGENIPSFNRSTVDGFALKAEDTFGSSEAVPSQLRIADEILMGEGTDIKLSRGECVKISTGGMLPEGADSVVMLEHTDTSFDDLCLVYGSVSPFENVTRAGDDISINSVALKKGGVIGSREIGILAGLGIATVQVLKKPTVAVISTGDEIVPIDEDVTSGKIRDINTHILYGLFSELGCRVISYGIVRDNYNDICDTLSRAISQSDIVLISGGSSAGTRDMTADIISRLGEVYAHGIAVKPGKPTIIGKIDGKAVFGLPGHPAAAYFVALRFVRPLVDRMLHRAASERVFFGTLTENISSNHGREELVCVNIKGDTVQPVYAKSGIISLLSGSDGYIVVSRNCEGLKKGEAVRVILF